LIVGMYCVLLYFLRFSSDHLSWLFLMYGLMGVYGYKGGVEEMEKIIVWQHGVRLKSLYFYGVLVLFFFLCLFLAEPR